MTSTARPPAHQVSRAVATINDVLDEVSGAALWSMDPAETADTLKALTRLASRTAELELRVAAH
ncbi:MAG: nuclease, partial [Nocardioides sp.]|nr:nuclease [Nocardioides sp.]